MAVNEITETGVRAPEHPIETPAIKPPNLLSRLGQLIRIRSRQIVQQEPDHTNRIAEIRNMLLDIQHKRETRQEFQPADESVERKYLNTLITLRAELTDSEIGMVAFYTAKDHLAKGQSMTEALVAQAKEQLMREGIKPVAEYQPAAMRTATTPVGAVGGKQPT